MYQLFLVVAFALLGGALGDKPGYGAPSIPQVKYGGPIVYSAEKPPIIHFPPPPQQVNITLTCDNISNCIELY